MKIAILILVVAVLLVSGCAQKQITYTTQAPSPTQISIQSSTISQIASETPISTVTESAKIEPTKSKFDYESLPKYASRYYRYSKEAYDAAIVEGKVVYLYFYANWCPICKEARPKILDAFNSIEYLDVIGFEVHYNDNEEKDFDKEVTRNYQVPYQHTTIIAKNKEQKFRSLEALTKEEIVKQLEDTRKA